MKIKEIRWEVQEALTIPEEYDEEIYEYALLHAEALLDEALRLRP